jgi:hypothetical protein
MDAWRPNPPGLLCGIYGRAGSRIDSIHVDKNTVLELAVRLLHVDLVEYMPAVILPFLFVAYHKYKQNLRSYSSYVLMRVEVRRFQLR